ncbi:MAG: UbiD family decarboxylase [Burkholderiales bacterium]|nr:UbiD family decarboxylase [Burkholderiales bacterium]
MDRFLDLRQYLAEVERHGELRTLRGAHWDLEMGALVELAYREGRDPKPLMVFEDIPGYPRGFRTAFGMLASNWRLAKTLGLPQDQVAPMQLHQNWYRRQRQIRPVAPRYVDGGPVMENSVSGPGIDMLRFPVPRFHEMDGGRYIGTAHAVIQKDPETGWVNVGTYRVMVAGPERLALHATPGKHGNIISEKYFSKGRVMPVAIAIGLDPVLWWLACQPDTPWGMSEFEAAGGITGEPLQLVTGTRSGLPFPAHAEIVIEGECHPGELAEEGPFGEWSGYYANRGLKPVLEPVIRVTAVHWRSDPILTCSMPSVPPHTFSLMLALADSVGIRRRLEEYGVPGIRGVWSNFAGSGGLFNVIALEQLYSGHALQAGILASQYSAEMGAFTVVVDDDIDPANMDQVLWAMTTRTRLDRQMLVIPNCHTNNVHPAIPPEEKMQDGKKKLLTSARVVIDACRELSWKEDWYPVSRMSPELREKTLQKWRSVLADIL